MTTSGFSFSKLIFSLKVPAGLPVSKLHYSFKILEGDSKVLGFDTLLRNPNESIKP